MAFHYPFIKPYKPITVFYNIIIPSKENTAIFTFIPLFAITGTPFYTVLKTTSPTPFLETILQN
jgi:hypothetical protein